MKLSILIPTFNESELILLLLQHLKDVKLTDRIEKQIIIVNDGSTDRTKNLVQDFIAKNPELNVLYLEHQINYGKGAAIQTGIRYVEGDFVIIQDADLEYNPNEYNDLLKPILSGHADVVYGSRFQGKDPHRVLLFWHYLGNKLLTFLSNLMTNLNLTDMEVGYKLFRTSIIQHIKLREKRFGFEPEITAKIARIKNIRIYEVGISYYGRTYSEGKKIRWKDGLRALYCIFKYAFIKN